MRPLAADYDDGSSVRITTADAARIYKVPARTIRRWCDEGRITEPIAIKGRLHWDAGEIDQLAALRKGRVRLRRVSVMTDTHGQGS